MSSTKYHINPETGRANICRAEKRECPIGGAHYDSKEEARAGYEKQQNKKSTPKGLKKTPANKANLKTLKVETLTTDLVEGDTIFIRDREGENEYVVESANGDFVMARAASGGARNFYTSSRGRSGWNSEYIRTVKKSTTIDFTPAEEYWYEKPLSRREDNFRSRIKDAIENGGKYTNEDYEKYKKLNTRAYYGGTEEKPKEWPPVPSAQVLEESIAELEREQLYGYKLSGLLRDRGLGEIEVKQAEAEGRFYLDTKVPSYYEVRVGTDEARHALGMKPRPKTKADNGPYGKALASYEEAKSQFFGKVFSNSEESRRAEANYDRARFLLQALKSSRS